MTDAKKHSLFLTMAIATLTSLESVSDYSSADHGKLNESRKWLNETPCLGTDIATQVLLYQAAKASKKTIFNKFLDGAIVAHKLYIDELTQEK